ncbi:MmyB family transcriptional regulator [Streptomyces violascens]|uniref:MmyB family transcriptional regulator n=1 Tax=Streptomyces violascens TaxID=67381 RepID=UPI00366215C1
MRFIAADRRHDPELSALISELSLQSDEFGRLWSHKGPPTAPRGRSHCVIRGGRGRVDARPPVCQTATS